MISVARSRVPWESSEKRFSFATFLLGFGKRKVEEDIWQEKSKEKREAKRKRYKKNC
ncbi:MAG: hypothetical protein J5848_03295 [Bacteroidales bacterium]|nr:hypothetical protein [Bacteroidales bacterium]